VACGIADGVSCVPDAPFEPVLILQTFMPIFMQVGGVLQNPLNKGKQILSKLVKLIWSIKAFVTKFPENRNSLQESK
jgi:hypothetical protein